MLWVLICTVHFTVSSYYFTYAFQSESTLYSCLNVKKILTQSRRNIWSLCDWNETRTHSHLARKRTLNYSDADPKLLCSSRMNGCPPQIFRVLCAELSCQTFQLYNTNCNIWLRQNNSLDLVLTYMGNSSKSKLANNTKNNKR